MRVGRRRRRSWRPCRERRCSPKRRARCIRTRKPPINSYTFKQQADKSMPEATNENTPLRDTFLAFIDLLGFSHRVETDFNETLSLYDELTTELRTAGLFEGRVQLSVISDSIIITSPTLRDVVTASSLTWPTITRYDFMARGGIASGLHVEASSDGNRLMVSQALVRAVKKEHVVRHPCVALTNIVPPPEAFAPTDPSNFTRAILWYEGEWIVNPLNLFWGRSAVERVQGLQRRFPTHHEKYQWFLDLCAAIFSPRALIPTVEEYAAMLGGRPS